MKRTFKLPPHSLDLNDVYASIELPGKAPVVKGLLKGLSDLFEDYKALAAGMDPAQWKENRAYFRRLKASGDVTTTSVRPMTSDMHEKNKRHQWDKGLTKLLKNPSFWRVHSELDRSATLMGLDESETVESLSYASHSSNSLMRIETLIFQRFQTHLDDLLDDLPAQESLYTEHMVSYRRYLNQLKDRLKDERRKMAQVMSIRLAMLDEQGDFKFDDVFFHIAESWSELGFNVANEYHWFLGPRWSDVPRRTFTSEQFHEFHAFIKVHGSEEAQESLSRLSWVRNDYYRYDRARNTWRTGAHIMHQSDIPTARSGWTWLFRGSNARYDAFHDASHYIHVHLIAKRLHTLRDRLEHAEITPVLTQRDRDYLDESAEALQQEHERIEALLPGLNGFVHWKATRMLNTYLRQIQTVQEGVRRLEDDYHVQYLEQVTACTDERSEMHLSKVLQDPEKQTRLLQSMARYATQDAVQDTVAALQARIDSLCLKRFSRDLEQLTIERHPVYTTAGYRYESGDVGQVAQWMDGYLPLVSQEKSALFHLVGRLLIAAYDADSTQLIYTELWQAIEACYGAGTLESQEIIQTIMMQVVLPSVAAPNSPGVGLLEAYMEAFPTDHAIGQKVKRLRRTIEQNRKELTFLLHKQLKSDQDAMHAQEVEEAVSGSSSPSNSHTSFLSDGSMSDTGAHDFQTLLEGMSCLTEDDITRTTQCYLDDYQGNHERLSALFALMPPKQATAYGRKRLLFLLKNRAFDSIERNEYLWSVSTPLFPDTTSAEAEALQYYLAHMPLALSHMPLLERLVERHAHPDIQALWITRRDRFLYARIKEALGGELLSTDTVDRAAVIDFLNAFHAFPAPDSAAEIDLLTHIALMPYREWSPEQHDLVMALNNDLLREVYMINLFQRVLKEEDFAIEHVSLLHDALTQEGAGFQLMSNIAFNDFSETVVSELEQRAEGDVMTGANRIQCLHQILTEDWATEASLDLLGLLSLKERVVTLFERYQDENETVVIPANEIISLAENGHVEEVIEKLERAVSDFGPLRHLIEVQAKESKGVRFYESVVAGLSDITVNRLSDFPALNLQEIERCVDLMPALECVRQFSQTAKARYDEQGKLDRVSSHLSTDIYRLGEMLKAEGDATLQERVQHQDALLANIGVFYDGLLSETLHTRSEYRLCVKLAIIFLLKNANSHQLPRELRDVLDVTLAQLRLESLTSDSESTSEFSAIEMDSTFNAVTPVLNVLTAVEVAPKNPSASLKTNDAVVADPINQPSQAVIVPVSETPISTSITPFWVYENTAESLWPHLKRCFDDLENHYREGQQAIAYLFSSGKTFNALQKALADKCLVYVIDCYKHYASKNILDEQMDKIADNIARFAVILEACGVSQTDFPFARILMEFHQIPIFLNDLKASLRAVAQGTQLVVPEFNALLVDLIESPLFHDKKCDRWQHYLKEWFPGIETGEYQSGARINPALSDAVVAFYKLLSHDSNYSAFDRKCIVDCKENIRAREGETHVLEHPETTAFAATEKARFLPKPRVNQRALSSDANKQTEPSNNLHTM